MSIKNLQDTATLTEAIEMLENMIQEAASPSIKKTMIPGITNTLFSNATSLEISYESDGSSSNFDSKIITYTIPTLPSDIEKLDGAIVIINGKNDNRYYPTISYVMIEVFDKDSNNVKYTHTLPWNFIYYGYPAHLELCNFQEGDIMQITISSSMPKSTPSLLSVINDDKDNENINGFASKSVSGTLTITNISMVYDVIEK